ncbi:MAG: efflux RND transporter periplasmic adaptor subunit, partial [Pirellulales bacterium]
ARTVLPAALFLLDCAGLSQPARAQLPPAVVAVAPVIEQGEVAAAQSFVGEIHPARRSIVGSAVGGRVMEFLVKEGDRVEARQPLARLLTRAIEIARDAALADVELRTQELAELESGSRLEEIQQAEAHMLGAKSLMEYAKAKLERTRNLIERRAASEDQLQDDAAAAESSLQGYFEAKAAYELAVAGPRKERIAQASARLASAKEEVARLEDQLEKHTIFSPFDGYVVQEHTEVGQWIEAGELVAEVIEVDRVDVEVMVAETYIPHLKIGTPARVEVDALPTHVFSGTVSHIVPQAEARSRAFPVKVQLANEILADEGPLLKPGMFARVTLPVMKKQSVLMVPKDALVMGGPEPVVYRVETDKTQAGKSTVQPVRVRLGVAYEGLVEVSGDLQPGQQVVIEGNERLFPGQEVVLLAEKQPARGGAKAPPADSGGSRTAARKASGAAKAANGSQRSTGADK